MSSDSKFSCSARSGLRYRPSLARGAPFGHPEDLVLIAVETIRCARREVADASSRFVRAVGSYTGAVKGGDQLETMGRALNFEVFGPALDAKLADVRHSRGGPCHPCDPVAMLQAPILAAQNHVSDAPMVFLIGNRPRWRCPGLELGCRGRAKHDPAIPRVDREERVSGA